jgi:alkylation response protein AidB-like acyl-CoA dehydrogenase
MTLATRQDIRRETVDWTALMQQLGPKFAERAPQHDATDAFVTQNFAELKEAGVFAAGVPAELGGGGASYPQLCEMLRVLAHYCGSTALTLSMHTHLIATASWAAAATPSRSRLCCAGSSMSGCSLSRARRRTG